MRGGCRVVRDWLKTRERVRGKRDRRATSAGRRRARSVIAVRALQRRMAARTAGTIGGVAAVAAAVADATIAHTQYTASQTTASTRRTTRAYRTVNAATTTQHCTDTHHVNDSGRVRRRRDRRTCGIVIMCAARIAFCERVRTGRGRQRIGLLHGRVRLWRHRHRLRACR